MRKVNPRSYTAAVSVAAGPSIRELIQSALDDATAQWWEDRVDPDIARHAVSHLRGVMRGLAHALVCVQSPYVVTEDIGSFSAAIKTIERESLKRVKEQFDD